MEDGPNHHLDGGVHRVGVRLRELAMVSTLLVLTALPDAMVVPILEEILVQRYDVGPGIAHAFLAVNLVGGLCALPILGWVAGRGRPVAAVSVAAAVDAALLAAMWLPIGFWPTIVLRAMEGVADVVVFAVIFDLVGRAGGHRSMGLRYGLAAAFLSIALGGGAILGGQIVRLEEATPGVDATVFLVGALACLAAACLAMAWREPLRRLKGLGEAASAGRESRRPLDRPRSPLWPLLLIAASDRAAGGLLTGTLGLFLASAVGLGPAVRGGLVGSVLLLMGLGAIPAGLVADRLGTLRVRLAGSLAFGLGLVILPQVAGTLTVLSLVMIVMGIGGAVLLPTSLSLLDRLHGGLIGMGGFRAAGDIGFLVGVTVAGFLVATLVESTSPSSAGSAYGLIFAAFGALHLAVTAVALPTLANHAVAET
ncbi:MAG: hypothetical protein VX726_11330 [Planctomycetota bacterium]|nr:hypothetical protein [Planctomycetota bacterium]